jgi:hypothetical protein
MKHGKSLGEFFAAIDLVEQLIRAAITSHLLGSDVT